MSSTLPQPLASRDAPARGSLLVVDDEPAVLRAHARLIESWGHTVTEAPSGHAAVATLQRHRFDAIVSDVAMPGLDGIGLLRMVRAHDLDVPVILLTGVPSVQSAARAVEHGALRYLTKPVEPLELRAAIARALKLHGLARLKRRAMELLGTTERQVGDRLALEVRFRNALAGIGMAYQPIVSWNERRILAYEALLRSSEPTLPDPGSLLTAAERLDGVHDLGRRVRQEVAADLARAAQGTTFFVNLHGGDLLDPDLFDAGAPLSRFAGRVTLEITERATLDEVPDVVARVSRLRDLGYRIAVDDLGAGYAGLTSLALLEPEVIKLDMSLTRGIDRDERRSILVRSLFNAAREMNVTFIAEGVETGGELGTLAQMGVDAFQGWLFARPARSPPPVPWSTIEVGG